MAEPVNDPSGASTEATNISERKTGEDLKAKPKRNMTKRPKRPKQLIDHIHNLEPGNRIKAFCLKGVSKFASEWKPYYPLCSANDAKIEANLKDSIVDRSFKAEGPGSEWILRLKLSNGKDLVFKFSMETKFKYYLA